MDTTSKRLIFAVTSTLVRRRSDENSDVKSAETATDAAGGDSSSVQTADPVQLTVQVRRLLTSSVKSMRFISHTRKQFLTGT